LHFSEPWDNAASIASPCAARLAGVPNLLSAFRLPHFLATHLAPSSTGLAALRHGLGGDIPLPCLAGPAWDHWQGAAAVTRGEHEAVRWADDGHSVFLHLVIADADWAQDPAQATESAYRRLDAARAACGATHYWRIWNYLGGILEGEGDAERYRQFTLGRHRAWAATGQLAATLPAATAIGCAEGLHLIAIAGRQPAIAIENPRQVSAWRYPREYGIESPSFTRASLVRAGAGGLLLVSGTASIVGHQSRHVGDIVAQFAEAQRNIEAVIAAAAEDAVLPRSAFAARNFKLYWAAASDAARHADLAQVLEAQAPTQVLLGAVCRRELAVEIEALYEITPGSDAA